MRAVRVHRFGPPAVIVIDDIQRPILGPGEILVRVAATGVGPWDALIREGKSKVSPPPPLTLGSDLSVRELREILSPVDVVIDTVGGETRELSFRLVKHGGIVVSVVSTDPIQQRPDVRSVFFYVEVTNARLNTISKLFDDGVLFPQIGSVLPLDQARTAHEMLAGAPHMRGKILLQANS